MKTNANSFLLVACARELFLVDAINGASSHHFDTQNYFSSSFPPATLSSGFYELEKIHKKFVSPTDDCHNFVRIHISDHIHDSPSQCQDECTKLSLSLILANCILSHLSFLPIECMVQNDCTLDISCLNDDDEHLKNVVSGYDKQEATSLLQTPTKKSRFNKPNQQSIVYTQAYGYVDEICALSMSVSILQSGVDIMRASNIAAQETLSIIHGVQETTASSFNVLTDLEGISKVTMKNSAATLDNSMSLLGMSKQHMDISVETGSLLKTTSQTVQENVQLSQELKQNAEKHLDMLQEAHAKLDEANHRLEKSVSLGDMLQANVSILEQTLIRILKACSLGAAISTLFVILKSRLFAFRHLNVISKSIDHQAGDARFGQVHRGRRQWKNQVETLLSENTGTDGIIWLRPQQDTVRFGGSSSPSETMYARNNKKQQQRFQKKKHILVAEPDQQGIRQSPRDFIPATRRDSAIRKRGLTDCRRGVLFRGHVEGPEPLTKKVKFSSCLL